MSNTDRDLVKHVRTPRREVSHEISIALFTAKIPHELHVRPGYVTIWADPADWGRIDAIADAIEEDYRARSHEE